MKVQAKIKKWGNSLALRLSGPMVAVPRFKENMLVTIHISEDGIDIRPTKKTKKLLPFDEAKLLEGLTPKKAHADEVVSLTSKEIGD